MLCKILIGQPFTSRYYISLAIARMPSSIMTSQWSRFRFPAPHICLIAGTTLGGLLVLRHVSTSLRTDRVKTVFSPRETVLPQLSAHETEGLPYPPNALPGARDVDSPFGSTRVYEWGPDDGEKILLIHGISTPSIALTDLAYKLVEKGCRVMLFGRSSFYSISTRDLGCFMCF